MASISITETVLRDGNQSFMATRMPLKSFESILSTMDKAGYGSVECWGGATFDSCLRYLNEDPWERLKIIRNRMPNSKLQMLLRDRNLLGYQPYSDEIIRNFIRCCVKNGIDIIRIFDALNDIENIKVAVDETIRQGVHASGAICYTISPVHTLDSYVTLAKQMEALGVHSICIKDMAGILSPQQAFNLVTALKKAVNLPIVLHTHCTTGLAFMTCIKAVEAGVDVIDTAISSFSGGSSQPATETLVYALEELGIHTGIDQSVLKKINEHFTSVRQEALTDGALNPIVLTTDTNALLYQIPGGMLSNLISQLKTQHAEHRFYEVLQEVPKVRKELGYPPLVTPMSQMVGAQAVTNILTGSRYHIIGKEICAYVNGAYGTAPGNIDETLKNLVQEKQQASNTISELPKSMSAAAKELGELAEKEEDILSYLAFPQTAISFFKNRKKEKEHCCPYMITQLSE